MRYGLPEIGPLERALQLRSLVIFRHLGTAELAACAQLTQERYLRRGEVLYESGQSIRSLHLLVDGRVRLERQGQRIGELGAAEDVELAEFLAGVPHPYRAIAETNALALVIDGAALLDLIEEHFPLFLQIRRALGTEVAQQQAMLRSYHTTDDVGFVGGDAARPKNGSARADPVHDFAEVLLALQRTRVFRDVGLALLAALIRIEERLQLAPGNVLWQRGDEPSCLALIATGEVSCVPESSTDDFRVRSGALLGVDAAFGGTPYAYSATATSPVTAFRIATQQLVDLAEDHFDLAMRVLSHCGGELLRLKALAASRSHALPPHPSMPTEVPS